MQGRIKEFFSRDRKILYMILSIVLISIFSLTIVYAALSVTLNIQGNAEVVASTWDIHLDNIKVTSGSASGNVPSITSPTTATFSTTLNMPGDFYEFTIDVVNNGSIDAMIENVAKTPDLTAEQAKYFNYDITYQNGESINTKQVVEKESFVRLRVRVEFKKDIVSFDMPTTSESLNLSFTVNYVQSDGSGSTVNDNGVYDPYKIGKEICFDSECFYIISSTDDTVTMLAKYNLYVGNVCEYSSSSSCTAYGEEATGKQDLNMIGYGKTPRKGTIQFSTSPYWHNGGLKIEYGTSYPAYVYDSNSLIYSYIENYKTYLATLGVTVNEARLISYEELGSLGCSDGSCSSAPSWIYGTSYWTGTTSDSSDVWSVRNNGDLVRSICRYNYLNGVRPVVVINKSLL